jgi:hypothetical protein
MTKSLNDILKRYSDVISGKNPSSTVSALTTGDNPGVDYADKMKDTRDFIAQHSVEKFDDRVGNGPDVYQAANVKKAEMERHGHEPKPKDIKVYKKNQQVGQPENKLKEEADLDEAKDNREYDYEGEMAVTKLKTIVRAAEHLIKMMKPNTNLPEWVQSKIIKSEDYITTAHDYLMSEMNEEVENLEEGGSQYRSAAGSGKNTNPNLSRLARKLAFEKPKSYRPPGTPSKAESKAFLDAEVAKFIKKGGKIRKEEVEELDEAKCNMTEAGKMCEVHGMKACTKEGTESASDKEPRYNGKKKEGRQLITDKKLQEMSSSQNQAIAARIALDHKRKGTMPPKGTASHSMMSMSASDLKDFTKAKPGAPKKVEESISDQRSSRSTASEKAREKIMAGIEKRKLQKEKMKEQAAPAETIIKMPSGEVGDTGRV